MDGHVETAELSLFGSASGGESRRATPDEDPGAPGDPGDPLAIIDDDLDVWERLCRVAALDPRESDRLRSLGRDLKALRDCFRATGHPRVRQALLREAETVSRRMRSQARRLRIPGSAIRVVPVARDGRAGA